MVKGDNIKVRKIGDVKKVVNKKSLNDKNKIIMVNSRNDDSNTNDDDSDTSDDSENDDAHLILSLNNKNIHTNVNNVKDTNNKLQDRFEVIFRAFQTYKRVKNIEGKFSPPQSFIVPSNDINWPPDTWGMKLGRITIDIRNTNKAWKEHRSELEELGFDYSPQIKIFKFENIYKAIETYKRLHNITGLFSVPQGFIIPKDDPQWPVETWGMNLGSISINIRIGKSWKKHRPELEELGFDFSPREASFKLILKAYETYKTVKGVTGLFSVPQAFCVPKDDDQWPKESWGMNLGRISIQIRNSNNWKKYRSQLEAIEFDYSPQLMKFEFKHIFKAYETYKRLNNYTGLFSVTRRFKVPYDDDNWPEETWGMNLGSITDHIRIGKSWKKYRKELEELGFDYSCQKIGYVKKSTSSSSSKSARSGGTVRKNKSNSNDMQMMDTSEEDDYLADEGEEEDDEK
jgi:hypothetical protein